MMSWPIPRWLAARAEERAVGATLYDAIVAEARSPSLYGKDGMPDSFAGRIELIMLFLSLVTLRINRGGPQGQKLARAVLEAFVRDVDDSCRRIGLGDMGVPRHVKKAAAAARERLAGYASALEAEKSSGPGGLEMTIASNLPNDTPSTAEVAASIASHARLFVDSLERLDDQALHAGRLA